MQHGTCALPGCESEFEFTPGRGRPRKFCSRYCSQRSCRDASGRICAASECTRPLRARGMCSMHWRRWARATGRESTPSWDSRRQSNYDKRRALKKGATVETFDRAEIFERDNWTCGICGDAVDPELAWPDPRSPSLDHVTPLTRGGAHSRDNTQCAHLGCNVAKGNRVPS